VVTHYLFNLVSSSAAPRPTWHEQATEFLRVRMWGVDADEQDRNALAAARP
jgi:hypothetical protein